ncbi:metallophosphoesterase [Ensifer soli]|uniref:metallophosphoesterase n=1 Tax=Ciceribacter sp. sgz301302 TaxID=3342379 RepID=UPI0035B732C0
MPIDDEAPGGRRKLFLDHAPEHVYAIGDVHGHLALLLALEARIAADRRGRAGEALIVMLGDYVDRGPASAAVIDHLLAPPPPGFQRICLAGNHEQTMLDFLESPSFDHAWLEFGGIETLASYDVALSRGADGRACLPAGMLPAAHLAFLEDLPSLLSFPGLCFVHAGVEAGVPLARQRDAVLLWTRPRRGDPPPDPGLLVVHGHTPVRGVDLQPSRINVDTGAFMTGILSCVRLSRGELPEVLQTG